MQCATAGLERRNHIGAERPQVLQPRNDPRNAGVRDDATPDVVDEVVLAGLARAHDLETEHSRPRDQPDQRRRLVAVDGGVDHAMLEGEPVEPGADHGVGLLGHHADVHAATQRGFGDRHAGLGRAGGLDDDVVRRLRQPVGFGDERDTAARGAHFGFAGADPQRFRRKAHLQQSGVQPLDIAVAQHGKLDLRRDPALRDEGATEAAIGAGQRDADPAVVQFFEEEFVVHGCGGSGVTVSGWGLHRAGFITARVVRCT